jgi:excisionase family DNA binding protein
MDVEALLAAVRVVVREELGVVRPLAVTLKEAARLMGVSPKHVTRMVGRGDLLTVEVGGARRIPMREVERHTSPPSMASSGATSERTRFDGAAAMAKLKALRKKA